MRYEQVLLVDLTVIPGEHVSVLRKSSRITFVTKHL